MFNQIKQSELAYQLGYTTNDTIRKAENSDFLPHKFVKAISELVGIDFTNQKTYEDYIKKIPEEVYHKYKVTHLRIFK